MVQTLAQDWADIDISTTHLTSPRTLVVWMSMRLKTFRVTLAIMGNLQESLITSSISSLLLHESSEDHSTPALSTPDMTLKQQFQAILPDIRRRRKLFQQSFVNSEHLQNTDCTSDTSPASKDQPTVSTEAPESPSEEPARKRYRIQQWLIHQSQRLENLKHGLRGHRDSMFEQADIEKELRLASQNANAIISGPNGEPIDQRVVDHFFMLFPACGSDWRDSARWERHQARCLQEQCNVCRSPQHSSKRSSAPLQQGLPSPSACSNSPKVTTAPMRQGSFEDDSLPFALLRPKACKRKEKGKSTANDGDGFLSGLFSRRRTQVQEGSPQGFRRLAKRPRMNVMFQAAVRRTQEKPVRCSARKEVLDPYQIPVPAVLDLKPADSSGFDLRNPAHLTGRPYDGCPLDEGRLPFPLTKNLLPPPSSKLNRERGISPPPEPLYLKDSWPVYSEEGVFSMSPLATPTSSTTDLQRGFTSTVRLVEDPCADDLRTMLSPTSTTTS